MTDLNDYNVIGRLTHDLDERSFAYTPQGTARMNLSIAVNRSVKRGDEWVEETSFFEAVVWGKTAENIKPYMTKGKQICINGYLKQDRWKDKETGGSRQKIYIVANSVQLLGGKSDGASSGGTSYQNGRQTGGYAPKAPKEEPQYQEYSGDDFPEEIPF